MKIKTIEGFGSVRDQYKVKGRENVLLVWRSVQTVKRYACLTVRQLYYILISRFKYPATKAFYKRMNRYLSKIRRVNPEVHRKFVDPTRQFVTPALPYPRTEIWVEKDSIRNFIAKLAAKHRLSIQVLRGFASLSMYRKALIRARMRGVGLVLYIGDFDPSGLLIEKVAEEEMDHKLGIRFVRLALTMEQIKRFKPPSRPVNLKDSRTKEYIEKYGHGCWDVEAIRPRTLHRLIQEGLEKNVPPEFLKEAKTREEAAKMAKPVTERLRTMIEREATHLLKEGKSEEEILNQLAMKYDISIRRRRSKRG